MFLPMGETLVIDRIFEQLEADERVSEVFVSTNERFAPEFETHIDESPYEKPTVTVEETTEEDEKFGVVGALAQLVEREHVDDDLMVIAGDNVISFSISDFVDFFEAKAEGASALAAYDVGDYERAKSYGLVELDGDEVVDFQEKPDDPNSTLVSIACYAFPSDVLPLLDTYLEDGNNPDEPGWFLQWLQARRAVHAFSFDEAWFDIGTAESYLDAVAWQLDGGSLVADGATVENTTLGETVHVMDGATVTDSSLERTVVFPDATIENCGIRNSIVDDHAHVANVDFADALIGAYTRMTKSE